MPRLPRHQVNRALETAEMETATAPPRGIREVNGKQVADALLVEQTDRPVNAEWANMMQFYAMPVTFVVNEDTNPNAENPILCQNNGENAPVAPRPGWLHRGVEYTIPRKFLESLLRAKIVSYTQKEDVDPSGVRHVINVPHMACRYQVRIINDPHARGADWLKHIMLEAP